jgi:hypothetical protein
MAINYSIRLKLNKNHKVLELSGKGLCCSKELLEIVPVNRLPGR